MKKEKQGQETIQTCIVCMERNTDSKIDSCHHQFCHKCIRKWGKRRNNCPICRSIFKKIIGKERTIKLRKLILNENPVQNFSQHRIIYIPIYVNIPIDLNQLSYQYFMYLNQINQYAQEQI